MAKRATVPKKAPALRVVSKQSPKSSHQTAEPGTGAGSNAADLETFHFHLGMIRRAQDAVAAHRKVLKDHRRKASDAGINLGDLDLVMKMAEQEPETVQETVRRIATYAHWMGLSPGVQADLFEAADGKEDAEAKAELEGYKAGIEGETATGDRYDAASPIGQARLRGHAKGQAILHDRFLSKQKPEDPPAEQTPAPEQVPEGETVN